MTPRAAPFFALLTVALAAACDSASVYEDCDRPEKEGTGEPRCFPSRFAKEDPRAREVAGAVSIGSERVADARVSVDGNATTTDAAGIYRWRYAPFFYDVAARVEDEVVAFHSAAFRFLDLALERDAPAKGFSGRVDLRVENAPREGHRRAVFVSGDFVVGLAGTLDDGLLVSSRVYENDKVELHVVEYPVDGGLEKATAKGSVDVRVRAETTTTATVKLDPIEERKKVVFTAASDAGDGFSFEELRITLDMGLPVSRVPVRTLRIGDAVELPVMEGAGWLASGRATRADGSFASIGLRPFNPGDEVTLAYYAPPVAERNEGSVLWAKTAQGRGVLEHVLVPVAGAGGGKTLHVFSAKVNTPVPDLAPLGLPPARGEYRWTVRVFPDWSFVEQIGPVNSRLYYSSSTSAPRTITLP